MIQSEYKELVEFLSEKFDGIDRRFVKVEVGLEENRHQIQVVAEGLTSLRREMVRGFEGFRGDLRSLTTRMDRWEARSL